MKKHLKILLIVLALPVIFVLIFGIILLVNLETCYGPASFDYDDPEDLDVLAMTTKQYIIRANPDRESPERVAALKKLEEIALLDVSDDEKSRLIRDRFPEESFWNDNLKELLRAAEAGDAEAQFKLGCFYSSNKGMISGVYGAGIVDAGQGKDIIPSLTMAGKWLRRAALQGHEKAPVLLFWCYENGGFPGMKNFDCVHERYKRMAVQEIDKWGRKAAEQNDPIALYHGYGAPEPYLDETESRKAALDMFREAAMQGDLASILTMAHASEYEEKYEWARKAAELGSVNGMMHYAYLLEIDMKYGARARTEEKSEEEAEREEAEIKHWRRKAFDIAMKHLDEGSAEDLCEWFNSYTAAALAKELEEYTGENNAAFAARILPRLWDLAEQHGDFIYAPAAIEFLHSILEGEGIEGLDDASFNCRAGELGYISERLKYAQMLLTGDGVPEDKEEAVRRLRILAGFGTARARGILGKCYLTGDGVPEDKEEAMKWLKQAAVQGDYDAMELFADCLRREGPWNILAAWEWSWRVQCYPNDISPTAHAKATWKYYLRLIERDFDRLMNSLFQ